MWACPLVQDRSASVWSSGETLEEGVAARYAVASIYSLQGLPGSGLRIDNTHLLAWFLRPVGSFPLVLKISACGTALHCLGVSI